MLRVLRIANRFYLESSQPFMFWRKKRPWSVRSLIPPFSHGDKKELLTAYGWLAQSFVGYLPLDFARATLKNLFIQGQFPLQAIVVQCLVDGFELIFHPLVDSTGVIVFKPDVSKLRIWIPWTVGTSVVSSVAFHTLRVASQNYYVHGKFTLTGFSTNLIPTVTHRIGFATGIGLARYYLPSAAALGGPVAKEIAAVWTGGLAGMTAGWLARGAPGSYSRVLGAFAREMPKIAIQSLFYGTEMRKNFSLRLFGLAD
jgi:hypothetical protein